MAETPQNWIPIGRGPTEEDLKKVADTLAEKWRRRFDYRIVKIADEVREEARYQLLVRHR